MLDPAGEVVGTIPVAFSDYGISDPSFGPAQVARAELVRYALANVMLDEA